MRSKFLKFLLLAPLAVCLSAGATTVTGTASFADTSSSSNNYIGFKGSFATPGFSFVTTRGSSFTDALTISPIDYNFLQSQSGTDTVAINLAFSSPSVTTGTIGGSGTISGIYNRLTGSINWANGGMTTIKFSDGTELLASIPSYVFDSTCGVTQTLTLKNVTPLPTPEPSSLVLLGTGLIGAATTMRRRSMASA